MTNLVHRGSAPALILGQPIPRFLASLVIATSLATAIAACDPDAPSARTDGQSVEPGARDTPDSPTDTPFVQPTELPTDAPSG